MTVRLLPYEVADGPHNMAADEVMLEAAVEQQIATLRFYGWSPTTASLGYFESAASLRAIPRLAHLPWVRRATGGGTLVHDREVTYALALPAHCFKSAGHSRVEQMHAVIGKALAELGVANVKLVKTESVQAAGLCFERHTPGDLLCRGSKVVGSAQRKHRGALLQHGGILLAQSEHTPTLPGLCELTGRTLTASEVQGAVAEQFARATGWTVAPGHWLATEREQIEELANSKFTSAAWNEKR